MSQKIIKNKNSISVDLEVLILREDEFFIAYCPSLVLSAYAKTEKNVYKSFEKSLKNFLMKL